MTKTESLSVYLGKYAPGNVAETILALSEAAAGIAAQIRNPQTMLDAAAGDTNVDGDTQKQLDVLADGMIEDALRDTATSVYLSEERAAAVEAVHSPPLAALQDSRSAREPEENLPLNTKQLNPMSPYISATASGC